MIALYAALIRKGARTIERVSEAIREQVRAALKAVDVNVR